MQTPPTCKSAPQPLGGSSPNPPYRNIPEAAISVNGSTVMRASYLCASK
jgi:hypothetical protein